MKHTTRAKAGLLATAALSTLLSVPAGALTIVLNDVGSTPMSAAQLAAFQQAATDWEKTYNDPITVYVNIAFNNLANNILGSTATARTTHPYGNVRTAMDLDAGVGTEKTAVGALPGASLPVTVWNGNRNDGNITLSTANAKALGLGTGLDPVYGSFPVGIDAEIEFNTDFEDSFDYDPSDGIGAATTDFVAVARHEIGHALGFFSLTDVQDLNTGFTLRANTLDMWRFEETGAPHTVVTERRLLTAGDAEYYDSVLNNVPMSDGSTIFDPLCNSSTGTCQASHWSDDQGNLMDPTLAPGIQQNLLSPDRHALDYVGYNRSLIFICCIELIPIWDFWWYWPIDPPPFIDWEFPQPPRPQEDPPEWANLGWASGMDLGPIGKRSAAGYARFEESAEGSEQVIEPSRDVEGVMNLSPPAEPMPTLPWALFEMTFISDAEAGTPFRFEATCGESGCQYDRSIGEYGGYRISGFLDGEGDGERDVDARVTLVMAADESGMPDPERQNVFKLDDRSRDSNLTIQDFVAFGLEPPPDRDGDGVIDMHDNCIDRDNPDQIDTDGDAIGNACDPDIAQPNDCQVNFLDLGVIKAAFFSQPGDDNWNADADLDGNDRVNFNDLGVMKEGFFGKPGPSGLPNNCD